MANQVLTPSEQGGVQYRRAKLWQIILVACNGLNGMAVYSLIGMASYAASIGFGISTLVIGGLLTFTRIFDAVTDPLLAFLYDRVNTKWGKVRPLMLLGWVIQSFGLLGMFSWFSSKGFDIVVFTILYIVYVIGYTIVNMTAQTLPALITNDPKQRPTVGVWMTIFNYLVPMALTMLLNMYLLKKLGTPNGDDFSYNQTFLTVAAYICVGLSLVGVILVCIGVSEFDKPENFRGTSLQQERLKLSDMWNVLKNNKPLQSYIISAASDKLAQQTSSQSIVTTLLLGIVIGNMSLGTMLSAIGIFPSIAFAIYGARYAGKHGNKESIVTWTRVCILANILIIAFFALIDPSGIKDGWNVSRILFILLTMLGNGFMMCVTTANTAFMADIVDYELDRSGQYIPAVISGTYSLIDKLVSAFSAMIATGGAALITIMGLTEKDYMNSVPQPGDPSTTGLFWITMVLRYGLAILGWLCTLWAMRSCRLTKDEMANVQKRIADKKAALKELQN